MNALIRLIRKDLADPMGSAITAALIASLIALFVIMLIVLEQKYILELPDSVREVGAEDDCAFGTHDVKRIGDHLYCIGEQ